MHKPSPALAVALLALFVSLGGSALAAHHYLITSTKQVSPKVRTALKGVRGATGTAGAPGAAGAKGDPGAPGSPGAPGPSASAVAQTSSTSATFTSALTDTVDFINANSSTSTPTGLFVMPFAGAVVLTAQVNLESDAAGSVDGYCRLAEAPGATPMGLSSVGKESDFWMPSNTAAASGATLVYTSLSLTTRLSLAAGSYNFAVRCAKSDGAGAPSLYYGAITAVATAG